MIYGALSYLTCMCHRTETRGARPARDSGQQQGAQQPGRRRAVREHLVMHGALARRPWPR